MTRCEGTFIYVDGQTFGLCLHPIVALHDVVLDGIPRADALAYRCQKEVGHEGDCGLVPLMYGTLSGAESPIAGHIETHYIGSRDGMDFYGFGPDVNRDKIKFK